MAAILSRPQCVKEKATHIIGQVACWGWGTKILQMLLSPPTLFTWINTLRPRQNGRHFADDTFKCIFLNENVRISIKISLKFVPKGPINNIPALALIMARCRPGHKPLSGPMMVGLPTHICFTVTRPQWVNFNPRLGWGQLRNWNWNWYQFQFQFQELELQRNWIKGIGIGIGIDKEELKELIQFLFLIVNSFWFFAVFLAESLNQFDLKPFWIQLGIPALENNYIHYKVYDEIIHPFLHHWSLGMYK